MRRAPLGVVVDLERAEGICKMHLQERSTLCSLPDEIVVHTLSLLHPVTLLSCREVCRLMLKIIDGTMVLNYHIELYADGMVDGPDSQLLVADRLLQLRARRQAWKELKWKFCDFPLIPGSWSAYELVDGVFSKTLNTMERNSARGIMFAQLPSQNFAGSTVVYEDLGITFRDFCMDPTQDLIVYMQCSRVAGLQTLVTLHFRTLSGNKVHPQACEPTVSVIISSEVLGAIIQTVDQVVGFMSWDESSSQLHMWDWKRSRKLVTEPSLSELDDFVFVTPQVYILTSSTHTSSFRVYTFNDFPQTPFTEHKLAQSSGPILRATLYLPQTCPNASASIRGIHTGPFTSASPLPHSLGRPPRPFITSPEARIHVVNIDLTSGNRGTPAGSCLIVIHNKTFLQYASAENEGQEVPWEEWGPENTRWIPGTTGSMWLRYVHGERLVRLDAGSAEGIRCLEVYDFGAPRGPLSWSTPREHAQMRQAHALILDDVFTTPVVFQLPCRLISKEEIFPYSGFMVDQDRLIGLKRHWTEEATSIDVFAL